ncbi:MAG: GNAT family N-acetyltransferase [Chloroflexota bacterium]
MTMHYRFLTQQDLPSMLKTFEEAFVDYYVEISFTEESFATFLATNGVNYELSVGAFDGKTMVGILLNAVDDWQGSCTAYDSGTGVIPDYRGQKIAGGMLKYAIPALQARGVKRYLLEVIQANEVGEQVYRKLGFEKIRTLDCLQGKVEDIKPYESKLGHPDIVIRDIEQPDWTTLQSLWQWYPAWQNTSETVIRTRHKNRILGAYFQEICLGYIIFYPDTGRIAQIAVAVQHQRQGIGTQLLLACAERFTLSRTISMINIDGQAKATLAFLDHHGFMKTLSQYEMVLDLK